MLSRATWPIPRATEAVEALARAVHLASGSGAREHARTERAPASADGLDSFLVRAAAALGLELEPVEATYGGLARLIRGSPPAVWVVNQDGEPRLLLVLRANRRALVALGPELERHELPLAAVRLALTRTSTAPLAGEVDALLSAAHVPSARLAASREVLLAERLAQSRIGGCFLMRTPAGGSAWQQVREAQLGRRLGALLALHALEYGLWIVSWGMIGQGALSGRLDPGWLLAWALVILTLVPLRLALTTISGSLAIDAGALLKRRLLRGALSVDTDLMRQDGVGRLLGRVIESESVESLAIDGGLLSLVAGVEILMSLVVLAWGAASPWLALSLVLWLGVAFWLGDRLRRRRRAWTRERLALTHDLVEKMSGHRTRLAQEDPGERHAGEDQALERYHFLARRMDGAQQTLVAIVPRGFLVIGLLELAGTVVPGQITSAQLAVTLGAILLSYRALRSLVQGLSDLMGAALAWQQVAPLFFAAREPALPAVPAEPGASTSAELEPVIAAQDLRFRYRDRGDPVLDGLSLVIRPGDRLLLEGPSGSGKSTLCAMLNGLRVPESGLLLLRGLDLRSLGESAWRRLVAAAPQFHENHVLANTLAFNLLMGRSWPPTDADCAEAATVCRELGLGPLLERMPSGLQQMVGDTGWQLSHGEKSRVYIARALLQRAELVLLDESFGALDPRTMSQVLGCVLQRASTLLVIAHP